MSLASAFPSPIDERTGLIRWIFDLPIQPGEPRIFNCAVKMAETVRYLGRPCYDNNGGSGLTRDAARQAAIGEGIERYCSSVYEATDLIFGSVDELNSTHCIYPPHNYALFHPEQVTDYSPFTAHTKLAWTWGFHLAECKPMLVPACLVYMPYEAAFLRQGEACIAPAVSTGLACARSREVALLKGIFELVERDAFIITWLNRLPMRQIEINTCPPLYTLYARSLKRAGLQYSLLDITTDIPIPTFLCLLIDWQRTPPMICAGGAANLDPVLAASKAMVEAVQTREWAKFLNPEGTPAFAADFSDIRQFDDHVRLFAYGDMMQAVEFLLQESTLSPWDWQDDSTGNTAIDLQNVIDLLAQHQVDVIAVDLTTVDAEQAGYFVTRAMAPSLQPLYADFTQRFLGGMRLYQVPRRLGFTENDTTIGSLNLYPHPYP